VAEFVQKAVGGDLFEIETVREYSKDYMTCTEEAKAELRESARPKLKKYLDSVDQYDTIFVGYPNWWGTMPIIDARQAKGLSQKELAEITGIKQPAIARLENGHISPSVDTINKLLAPLGKRLAVIDA